jgi:hypothetical protein
MKNFSKPVNIDVMRRFYVASKYRDDLKVWKSSSMAQRTSPSTIPNSPVSQLLPEFIWHPKLTLCSI